MKSAEEFRNEGNNLMADNDFISAVECYGNGIEAYPSDYKLYSNRSLGYYRLKDFEKALCDAEKTINLKDDWEKGYIRKALALIELNRSEQEVLECYEVGVLKCPHSTVLARSALQLRERLQETLHKAVSSGVAESETNVNKKEKENTRVKFNDSELNRHEKERGVLYGTMKIDHPDTPFLVYDKKLAEESNLIGMVENREADPTFVDIDELRAKLGLLQVEQEQGNEIVKKQQQAFEERRKELYRKEGDVFLKSSSE